MNYTTLKSSIADFLNRQDLTAVIPTFIALCEADLNRTVRHRSMLTRATATLDTQFTKLPLDYLEAKNVQLNTTPVTSLKYVTMEQADLLRQTYRTAGVPKYYTLVGDTIEVVPEPADEYTIELVYYKSIPSLSRRSLLNPLILNRLPLCIICSAARTITLTISTVILEAFPLLSGISNALMASSKTRFQSPSTL